MENTFNDNYPDYIERIFEFKTAPGQKPERLDVYLTHQIIHATRSKVQQAIEEGLATVNGSAAKVSRKIQPGDEIVVKLMKPPPISLIPENIPLDIIYEDDCLLVVNKPAGMVTHPGFGNRRGTLVNAVLFHVGMRDEIVFEYDEDDEEMSEADFFSQAESRPGVVHRLDKDTSGLLVVSKDPVSHAKLAKQFADRSISREYAALVWGALKEDKGTIEGNIGRSPRDRKLFAVVKKGGKKAITDYEIIERFNYLTLIKVSLRTGRTHQIRVHFSHNKHPLLADPDYSGNSVVYGGANRQFRTTAEKILRSISRQMLHARTLRLVHPKTGEKMQFECPLPQDMLDTIDILKKEQAIL